MRIIVNFGSYSFLLGSINTTRKRGDYDSLVLWLIHKVEVMTATLVVV